MKYVVEQGWEEWKGVGKYPSNFVDIMFRDGTKVYDAADRPWYWAHVGQASDIVAYRTDFPLWDGKGIPAVGTVCEHNFYDRSGDNWRQVEVLFVGKSLYVVECEGVEIILKSFEHTRPLSK